MKYLLGAIIASLVIGYTFSIGADIMNEANLRLTKADREYWRRMASSPEWLCRARGGNFKLLGFATTFGTTHDQLDWQCLEIEK